MKVRKPLIPLLFSLMLKGKKIVLWDLVCWEEEE